MDIAEAAEKLKAMYDGAPPGEKVTNVLLFGIKYARELEGVSIKALVTQAGIPESYDVEVNNGKNLAKYVELI